MNNREYAKATMLDLLEALSKEAKREPMFAERIAALSKAISALSPMVQVTW